MEKKNWIGGTENGGGVIDGRYIVFCRVGGAAGGGL